jgi:hypothetical protein
VGTEGLGREGQEGMRRTAEPNKEMGTLITTNLR